ALIGLLRLRDRFDGFLAADVECDTRAREDDGLLERYKWVRQQLTGRGLIHCCFHCLLTRRVASGFIHKAHILARTESALTPDDDATPPTAPLRLPALIHRTGHACRTDVPTHCAGQHKERPASRSVTAIHALVLVTSGRRRHCRANTGQQR